MRLDVPTLMFAGAFVSALCGSFLVFVWSQQRPTRAALWWAAALLARGAGILCLAFSFTAWPPLFLAGLTLIVLSPILAFSGFHVFYGRPVPRLPIALGFGIWAAAAISAPLHPWTWLLAVVHALVAVAFESGSIFELLRHREEKLRAALPVAALLAVDLAIGFSAIPAALSGGLSNTEPPPLASLFGLIHFVSIVYLIGMAVFLFALIRERNEMRLLHDAHTDALTGLANRRAFLKLAERIAERCRRQREGLAVVVFDLDRFKSVNDSFGHAIGDSVLRVFASAARESLRPGDIVSRVGGEEFFAILPGADLTEACRTADRVRLAFEQAAATVAGRGVCATVSAGVAAADRDFSLAELLEMGDAALYRAKLQGRNRVECAEVAKPAYPRLVRVA